jgi:dihydrofolate reductase
MSRLTCSISVSLHEWIFGLASWREMHGKEGGEHSPDSDLLQEGLDRTGAFVLTHYEREPLTLGQTTFTFVSDGIESALEQARAAAGGKDVSIGGGANVIQQYLAAGLLDELLLSVVPVLLGGGVRLLDGLGDAPGTLERTRVLESPSGVTHLGYRVAR